MKSISTGYQSFVSPPGPFAVVTVTNVTGSVTIPNRVAQIDSAADRTVFPQSLIDALGAIATGAVSLLGFGGTPTTCLLYEVLLSLPSLSAIQLEVIAHADEPWVLLGRDVLNRYVITLDGPALRLTINERP
jgi:hypothetical protein